MITVNSCRQLILFELIRRKHPHSTSKWVYAPTGQMPVVTCGERCFPFAVLRRYLTLYTLLFICFAFSPAYQANQFRPLKCNVLLPAYGIDRHQGREPRRTHPDNEAIDRPSRTSSSKHRHTPLKDRLGHRSFQAGEDLRLPVARSRSNIIYKDNFSIQSRESYPTTISCGDAIVQYQPQPTMTNWRVLVQPRWVFAGLWSPSHR